jgi:hypothetical protein
VIGIHQSVNAAENNWAVSPNLNYSSDSDGLTINKLSLGILPGYDSATKFQGLEWQEQRYQQNNTTINGQGFNYTWQSTDVLTGMGHSLRAGLNQIDSSKTIMALDWNFNKAQNDFLNWGVTVNSDWVDSITALQNGTYYNLVGGNLDLQIHPRVTLVGALTQTHFSDDHNREQQRIRAIWDAWPDQGITLQWSFKHQYGETVANPTYFNPSELNESMAIAGWRKRLQNWQYYVRLGGGTQTVNSQPSSPTRMAEVQITSTPKNTGFYKVRLGYSETYGINGPGYTYRYADLQYIWPLGR